jgi:DNA-binding transcriptional ArsR family regulator
VSESLEERVERIERVLGLRESAHQERNTGSGRLKVAAWLRSHRNPGETISAVAILSGSDSAETVTAWEADEAVGWESDALRKAAGICEALSNDVRLALLQELLSGPKSTAHLLEVLSLDRSPLYHHLRYLFAHGFIEQPDRGSYALTLRGRMVILLIGHLAYIGPESIQETPELDTGV